MRTNPRPALIARIEALLTPIQPLTRILQAQPRARTRGDVIADLVIAGLWGAVCHVIFALAVAAMIIAMWFGMTQSFGTVPQPWAWLANIALLAQFPVVHSALLTSKGRALLACLGPRNRAGTLATTTYAIIAACQLLALFALWTPSGVVWWEAQGWALWLIAALYTASWLLLIKASWDAGAEVQSGLLGWASLARGIRPPFPPMPTRGLFRLIRQPIYLAFALTTWTVPVWTPDQLLVAVVLTAYCAAGPLAKERRFARQFGDAWTRYKARHGYWWPKRV
ncbi:MAG: isoprenylcysteine carboxylmethyltransferase family protein [Pseudomonadota bacterium]